MAHDGEACVQRRYREELNHEQLVNRPEGVVTTVVIGGKLAWQNDRPTEALGKEAFGRLLKRAS